MVGKIILPIRIKTVLKEWMKANIFKFLIYNLRKISFISHMMIIYKIYNNKCKKMFLVKLRYNLIISKVKNYYLNEFAKGKMQILFKNYLNYKWNIEINKLSKQLIENKNLFCKEK